MTLLSLLALYATLPAAHASELDAHGAILPPDGVGLHGGFTTLEPAGIAHRSAAVGVTGEHIDNPLTLALANGDERALLGRVTGGTVSVGYGLHRRVSLGASFPMWASAQTSQFGEPTQVRRGLSDFELWVPVRLFEADGARPALTLAPVVRSPAMVMPWLSDNAAGAALVLAAQNTHGRFGWTANAAAGRRNVDAEPLADTGGHLSATAALSFAVTPTLAPAGELRLAVGPGGYTSEGALGLRALAADGRVGVLGGVARGVISGPGAANFRAWLGVTVATQRTERIEIVAEPEVEAPEVVAPTVAAVERQLTVRDESGRALRGAAVRAAERDLGRTDHQGSLTLPADLPVDASLTVTAEGFQPIVLPASAEPAATIALPAAPLPVSVRVVDANGQALPAVATWEGPAPVAPAEVDTLGNLRWKLTPGEWRLRLEAEGLATQERTFRIALGDTEPLTFDAVLHKAEGDGSATLLTQMPDGSAGPSGVVTIAGKTIGTLPERGTLTVTGLLAKEAEVRIASADRPEPIAARITPTAARVEAPLTLAWLPGTVRVRASGPDGAVSDALIAFQGPASLRPARLGPDGERLFTLRPGDWEVLASSAALGSQARTIRVDAETDAIQDVMFQLIPEERGTASLTVEVVDPDGRPLPGLALSLDGEPLGLTANRGQLSVQGLDAGTREIRASSPHHRELTRELRLTDGEQRLELVVGWQPGAVLLSAVDPAAKPVDARVAVAGPTPIPSFTLGADGEEPVYLTPGSWELLVSDRQLGMRSYTVDVAPEEDRLRLLQARLSPVQDEVSSVSIQVTGPDGQPVPNAEIRLDDAPIGVAAAGRLQLGGLPPGPARFTATAEGLAPASAEVRLSPGGDPLNVSLAMAWAPGLVDLVVTDAAGRPLPDALVIAEGARRVPVQRTNPKGEARLALAPGAWWLMISSSDGALEVPITLTDAATPTRVAARLKPPPPGRGSLLVHVRGPDGRPVVGARVLEDGVELGITSGGGSLILDDREPGPVAAEIVPPPGWLRGAIDVVIGSGSHRTDVTVPFQTHPVALSVADEDGAPIAAQLWLEGPTGRTEHRLAAGQSLTLPFAPGDWQVSATAPERSIASQALRVDPAKGAAPLKLVLEKPRARVVGVEVRLDETVHFDVGLAVLRSEAGPLLDQLAAALLSHPELARIEVQGHTDDQGGLDANLLLSRARADAVRAALIARGVPPERLLAQGYGPLRPLQAGTSEAARAVNRRVELKIVEQRAE